MNQEILSFDDYPQCLTASFDGSYKNCNDAWSKEEEMRNFIKSVINSHDFASDSRILDIGAGRGADSSYLLELGYTVIALDICRTLEWNELERQYLNKLTFFKKDFMKWDAEGLNFDLIIDNGCFHHQHPKVLFGYLQKISQLMKPNGVLAINVFCNSSPNDDDIITLPDGRLVYIFNQSTLKFFLLGASLNIISARRVFRRSILLPYDYLYITATHCR
jgi:cyclopropane fatty-acyl-phospholipid synthase-like methyltransferase